MNFPCVAPWDPEAQTEMPTGEREGDGGDGEGEEQSALPESAAWRPAGVPPSVSQRDATAKAPWKPFESKGRKSHPMDSQTALGV